MQKDSKYENLGNLTRFQGEPNLNNSLQKNPQIIFDLNCISIK